MVPDNRVKRGSRIDFIAHTRSHAVSGNGRYVIYESQASNLINNDTNTKRDLFRYDGYTNDVVRLNVDRFGNQAKANNFSERFVC